MDRNLVLLLTSGHTVKIALKPEDLPDPGTQAVFELLDSMPAVAIMPGNIDTSRDPNLITFAFIEDMAQATVDEEPNEFQRIDAYSPGEAL